MKKPETGIFTVSLDFELYWGVRDKRTLKEYGENLRGVRKAIPRILNLFEEYGIHATWATVGFLHFQNRQELLENLPECRPAYTDQNLSPYNYIENNAELDPEVHFAPDLIDLIRNTPGQEIATHTFSHFYSLEEGQNAESFRADLEAAIKAASRQGLKIDSLVFARNQVNEDYLPILAEVGIKVYRGCENSWLHRANGTLGVMKLRRALRLIDSYINLSGHQSYEISKLQNSSPVNVPASRFLRPYNKRLTMLDGLQLKRISNAMNMAAKNKRLFHLWWHPHNFGSNLNQNLKRLDKVLANFKKLSEEFEFQSRNMGEILVQRNR